MAGGPSRKELRAQIVIGGKADNTLTRLGSTIEALGRQVNTVSSRIIDFGKESVDAFVNYQDAMLDAQVALHTTYTGASDLSRVMDQLGDASMKWASTSRFDTAQVASAISNAAHAGWDLEQIMTGVPNAMNIAQAGSMDLAQSVEYLVDVVNASGIGFEELTELTDYWAFAANKSSTTIPEMGEAMQRMGATMQFVKGDMAALTTMLAVLADNGTKGTDAGTLLRNSLIRLIAPTKKAAETMDGLALSGEELDDIYANPESLNKAVKALEDMGFSAYTSTGELKPFLQIFEELNAATAQMTEEERNNVLSAIFPTRTLSGALALLKAAGNEWDGLYDSIKGNSAGYADYARETMESGLGGTMRMMQAAWNALQTRSGAQLESPVTYWMEQITNFINGFNDMDDVKFAGIIGSLEALAAAGPMLMTAGGALTLIGKLIGTGPMGWTALAAIGLGMLTNALNEMEKVRFRSLFGELTVDGDALRTTLDGINGEFRQAFTEADNYADALGKASEAYKSAGSSLMDGMFTTLLKGGTLSQGDIDALKSYGGQMESALIEGVKASYSKDESLLMILSGMSAEDMAQDDGPWGQMLQTLNTGYEQSLGTAEALSQQLRDAMTKAFDDGQLTPDEIQKIQAITDQMNAEIAKAQDEQRYVDLQRIYRRSQSLGIDGFNEFVDEVGGVRDSEWETRQDEYARLRYRIMDSDEYSQEEKNAQLAELDSSIANQYQELAAKYDKLIIDQFATALMPGSEFGDIWSIVSGAADNMMQTGQFDETAWNSFNAMDFNSRKGVAQMVRSVVEAMGGAEALTARMNYFGQNGDTNTANQYGRLLLMDDFAGREFDRPGAAETLLKDMQVTPTLNTLPMQAQMSSALNTVASKGVTVDVRWNVPSLPTPARQTYSAFAEGGRATTASIFGEAGPEWAIPEAHDDRTRSLLNAARAASGFSWDELMGGTGRSQSGGQFIFSPTIYANDATGVEDKLRESEERMKRWYADERMKNEIISYR